MPVFRMTDNALTPYLLPVKTSLDNISRIVYSQASAPAQLAQELQTLDTEVDNLEKPAGEVLAQIKDSKLTADDFEIILGDWLDCLILFNAENTRLGETEIYDSLKANFKTTLDTFFEFPMNFIRSAIDGPGKFIYNSAVESFIARLSKLTEAEKKHPRIRLHTVPKDEVDS